MNALQKVLFVGGFLGFIAAEIAVYVVQQVAQAAQTNSN
jgi:hypothetical protein